MHPGVPGVQVAKDLLLDFHERVVSFAVLRVELQESLLGANTVFGDLDFGDGGGVGGPGEVDVVVEVDLDVLGREMDVGLPRIPASAPRR